MLRVYTRGSKNMPVLGQSLIQTKYYLNITTTRYHGEYLYEQNKVPILKGIQSQQGMHVRE